MQAGKGESKRICIISQYWSPDVVGDVSRVSQVVDALKADGWRITLVTSRPHYPYGDSRGFKFRFGHLGIEDGVWVARVAMPKLPHRGFFNRLILYVWFSSFAAIFTLFLSRGSPIWAFSQRVFSTYAALPSKMLWNSVLVSDVTDIWPEALVNTGYASRDSKVFAVGRFLASFAYRISDAISTMTPELAASISSLYSVPTEKVVVVPYLGRSFPDVQKVAASFTVMYYGNLGPNYDFDLLLAVAARLIGKDVRFIIRGEGEGLARINRAMREERLDNVQLMTSALSEPVLAGLVASADVFILPMKNSEFADISFPGKFVEYLRAGKPIVYVGRDLPARLIEEYKVGLATSDRDANKIADYILRLKDDAGLTARLGLNARKLAEERFSSSEFNKSMQILERVLVRSSP